MVYRILVDWEWPDNNCDKSTPIYKEFTSAKEANDFVQNYLETQDFSVVGVSHISDEVIELYCDVV